MAGSVIRNYTIEVDKINKKSIFSIYPYPVEILTPNGWESIQEEFEELQEKIWTRIIHLHLRKSSYIRNTSNWLIPFMNIK
ncbi:hypothetical protein ACFQY3_23710 [Paenibacillus farraposensis]|uniref:hypothetical protein n=1 Tax=Paenibacillus farraposensis TaxID=2807095 RepID=UPI00361E4A12